MFREYINNPIDPIPVEYVNKLKRISNEPDYSLTCLGIALLKHRIEDYQGIDGVYNSFTLEKDCVANFIEDYKDVDSYPRFCYYAYSVKSNDEEVKTKLTEHGFEIKESIGALLKDKADTKCIAAYHKTMNCAAIFINSKDIRFYHMLISFLSLLFPNLFAEKPLEERDYNIIKALSKTSKNAFTDKIREAVEPYAMEFRRMMLCSLMKRMHEVKIVRAQGDVDSQRNVVRDLSNRYAQAMKQLKDLIVIFEGMKATESYDQAEEDLVEYLATNKLIHNLNIDNNKLTFTVATLLNNYNENAWSTFDDRGYIYDGNYTNDGRHTINLLDVFKKRENRKILLNSIFSAAPEFVVKIAGNYCLNFEECRITTNRNFDYNLADPLYHSYMPNPHLKIFGCLGGYETRVNKALQERNYIGAIEMCCASAGSVDLDETEQTFRPFIGWLMSSREKVLKRKDGNDMTPEEALLYLIDKEKTNETDTND